MTSRSIREAVEARKQEKARRINADSKAADSADDTQQEPTSKPTTVSESIPEPTTPRKRGRPAKGKRSNDEWIGRTFYIKRDTDLDAEELLLKLKRKGVEIDKSELVEKLLAAWVRWQNGENIEICLDEISPIQK